MSESCQSSIEQYETEPIEMGAAEQSYQRTIRKYNHPDGIKSCQLVMGMTTLGTRTFTDIGAVLMVDLK